MTLKKIECHDLNEHTKAIADYLPGGDLWAAKNIGDTNLRKFLEGLAAENVRTESYLKALQDQFIPDETENFIEEWERVLAIPDDCFDGQGTIEERRLHVLVKLASLGVQTAQDFENLALQFGVVATVSSGPAVSKFPLTFPFEFPEDLKFVILIEFSSPLGFPYTFPIPFGTDVIIILECLFNKLKPANVDVIFTQV